MAQAFSFQIDGLDKLKAAFAKKEKQYTDGFAKEIKASGLNVQRGAKSKAPKNFGRLAQSIALNTDGLTSDIVVGVSYGAYLEFGTGGKVSVPSGFQDFAAQFKGSKGGTFKEMVDALTEWVRKKGLAGTYSIKTQKRTGKKSARGDEDREVAFRIALSILKHGIKPQPFLIPSFLDEKPKLIQRIKELL